MKLMLQEEAKNWVMEMVNSRSYWVIIPDYISMPWVAELERNFFSDEKNKDFIVLISPTFRYMKGIIFAHKLHINEEELAREMKRLEDGALILSPTAEQLSNQDIIFLVNAGRSEGFAKDFCELVGAYND